MDNDNARSSDGAENAERAKAKADSKPVKTDKNLNQFGAKHEEKDGARDLSKLSKEEALAQVSQGKPGAGP